MQQHSDYKILLVDDDHQVLAGLELLFQDTYALVTASSGQEAIDLFSSDNDIAVVVMDIKMPRIDGIETARTIKELAPDILVIFHTGFPGLYAEDEIDTNEKPFEYVQKGGPVSRLVRAVRNAMDVYISKQQATRLTSSIEQTYGMVGQSELMRNVYDLIRKVAPTDSKVMVLGETGTGKELVARAIHTNSLRQDKKLVIFNCNHKSPDLVESELFGHGKGAFTGAVSDNVGLFEYASNGTIFLDEIGDLDITTQAKVLRVLETGEFQTLGKSTELKQADVRILCATHHDLEKLVKSGKFREDLYYRLKGVTIRMPSLRDRREDIPLLVSKFTDRVTIECDQLPKYFDQSAIHVLLSYDWPGNVRQLLDTIESVLVLADSGIITGKDIEDYLSLETPSVTGTGDNASLSGRVKEFRRNCIIEALHETGNNVNAAARLLQVDPANLRKWINGYGISLGS